MQKVDAIDLARSGGQLQGELPLSGMRRLVEGQPEQQLAVASWCLEGSTDVLGRHFLMLEVQASPWVVCQRCLKPFAHPLATNSRFVLTSDPLELEADESDDDAPEPLLATSRLDVSALIEDELILALPYAPRHPVCPTDDGQGEAQVRRESPFAVLAGWKPSSDESGK